MFELFFRIEEPDDDAGVTGIEGDRSLRRGGEGNKELPLKDLLPIEAGLFDAAGRGGGGGNPVAPPAGSHSFDTDFLGD